jgi:arylsulfatase A
LAFNHIPRARTGLHPDEVTLAELLKSRGYATKIIGKWHLGDAPPFRPMRHGFDSWFGLPYSNDMWPNHPKVQRTPSDSSLKTEIRQRADFTGYDGKGQTYPLDWFPDLPLYVDDKVLELNPDQRFLTSRYTDQGLTFIEEHRDEPFFLYLAHAMPHVPLFSHPNFKGSSLRGLYGDVIEEIDHQVGRILAKISELGIEGRTLVIFTSDNGPWVQYGIDAGSTGPLRGSKGTNFEGGVRVPCILRWPGWIPAGEVTSALAANLDFFPTIAFLAGAEIPRDRVLDGLNLWPLLSGETNRSEREAFYYYAGGMRYHAEEGPPQNDPRLEAIRVGRWKLHLRSEPGASSLEMVALFDLQSDIGESHDRLEARPDIASQLRERAQQFNDSLRAGVRPLGRLD